MPNLSVSSVYPGAASGVSTPLLAPTTSPTSPIQQSFHKVANSPESLCRNNRTPVNPFSDDQRMLTALLKAMDINDHIESDPAPTNAAAKQNFSPVLSATSLDVRLPEPVARVVENMHCLSRQLDNAPSNKQFVDTLALGQANAAAREIAGSLSLGQRNELLRQGIDLLNALTRLEASNTGAGVGVVPAAHEGAIVAIESLIELLGDSHDARDRQSSATLRWEAHNANLQSATVAAQNEAYLANAPFSDSLLQEFQAALNALSAKLENHKFCEKFADGIIKLKIHVSSGNAVAATQQAAELMAAIEDQGANRQTSPSHRELLQGLGTRLQSSVVERFNPAEQVLYAARTLEIGLGSARVSKLPYLSSQVQDLRAVAQQLQKGAKGGNLSLILKQAEKLATGYKSFESYSAKGTAVFDRARKLAREEEHRKAEGGVTLPMSGRELVHQSATQLMSAAMMLLASQSRDDRDLLVVALGMKASAGGLLSPEMRKKVLGESDALAQLGETDSADSDEEYDAWPKP